MYDMAEELERELPEGWNVRRMEDPFAGLVCPHGHSIELDGKCPDGCESPLLDHGLV